VGKIGKVNQVVVHKQRKAEKEGKIGKVNQVEQEGA
jgi:hypothetical protein